MERPSADHLVVGLGNPGPRYEATRHNVGFRVVDLVAHRWGAAAWREACRSLVTEVDRPPAVLAKPATFMNRSGLAVAALLAREPLPLERVVVVHDDLDLPFGRLKIRDGGGHGGHNGIRSIVEALGDGGFLRLKVGIGRPEQGEDVAEFVLSPFGAGEEAVLSDLLARAADALESIVIEGPLRAMHRFHSN